MGREEGEPRISRRKAIKLGFFGVSVGYSAWSYLYRPKQTETRKQYDAAYQRWEDSYKALKGTGGIVDKGFPILRSPTYDPSNPNTQRFYDTQKEVNTLGGKIKDEEFPVYQIQSTGRYLGPLFAVASGINLIPRAENETSKKPEEEVIKKKQLIF